jgi:hypothetical protein
MPFMPRLKKLIGVALLLLTSSALAQTVTPTFFGMHMNRSTTPWPTGRVAGSYRVWDSFGAQWWQVNTAKGVYDWTKLDSFLKGARSSGIHDVLYSLGATPTWASQRGAGCKGAGQPDAHCTGPADNSCDFSQYGAVGSCYSNVDLHDDGTGTDETWKDWITALATHVNSLDRNVYAHVGAYEIWNEIHRGVLDPSWGKSGSNTWNGTYNQLIRMAQDARSIIKRIDPNALIVSPSFGFSSAEIRVAANFLYCNQSPTTVCTLGSQGSAAVDVTNAHAYPHPQPESYDSNISKFVSNLSATDKAKPFWVTEGGWGKNGNVSTNGQSGFIARWYALLLRHGISRGFWYQYDNQSHGTLYSFKTKQLTPAGVAMQVAGLWMVGQTFGGCTTANTVWVCQLGANQMVWDKAGSSAFNTNYTRWADLSGGTHVVTGGQVMIGPEPILLN